MGRKKLSERDNNSKEANFAKYLTLPGACLETQVCFRKAEPQTRPELYLFKSHSRRHRCVHQGLSCYCSLLALSTSSLCCKLLPIGISAFESQHFHCRVSLIQIILHFASYPYAIVNLARSGWRSFIPYFHKLLK